ncbi:anti-sigma factor family protein [Halopseudomonas xiamenensis]|uniref:anti-sigma factor family protein n=1 Tax=Halopseudomonas xiamenensis TaxID=157792 RepID=UPI001623EBF5|nr:zf-HC2 domain-containing protein [Halopseudomonas xiamenensis]
MTEHPDITQLSAHLDNELSSADMAQTSSHLLSCPICQRQYRDLRELSQDMHQLPMLESGLDLPMLLRQLPERQPVARRQRGRRALSGTAAAASLLLGLFIGTALHSSVDIREPSFAALAILDNTPPGALCRQPELCYLQRSPR